MLLKTPFLVLLASSLGAAGPLQYVQEYLGVESHSHKNLTLKDVRHELMKAEIIPTVIHDFNASFLLNVTWIETHTSHHSHHKNHSSYNKTETAKLGNKLSPKKLHHTPMVELYSPTDSSSLSSITPQNNLVITMTDPDAKSSEMCHWIGIGLPVEIDDDEITSMSHKHNFTNGIHDVVSYLAPSPPPKTGKHRYVFLAFRPANGTNEPLHLIKPESRQHWGMGSSSSHGGSKGVRQWAEMNGLIPIAANFVYSKNKKQ